MVLSLSAVPSDPHMMPGVDLLAGDAERALRGVFFEKLRNRRILVTGASGLIGTHLLSCSLKMQQQLGGELTIEAVVGSAPPSWLESFKERLTIRIGDLTQPEFLKSIPAADIIIHAATYGQPGRFTAQAKATLKLNTITTFSLIDKLQAGGNFVFFSSSEVYSGLSQPPFCEDQIGTTNPSHARACYIEGKRCGEAICNAYRREGLDVKSIRLCSTYGPGVRAGDQRVLYHFAEQAIKNGRIDLLDAGMARRTYCYISDVGAITWKILLWGHHEVYNLGGAWRLTIADLARQIGRVLNVPVYLPVDTTSGLEGAPDDVQVDMGRFVEEFGPHEFLNPSEGLARTLEWCRRL